MSDPEILQRQSIYLYTRYVPTYTKLYRAKTTGMREAINSFLLLRMHTIRELRGRFSKNELTALTDLLKHFKHFKLKDPANLINKDGLISFILDSEEWSNLEVSHGIDYSDLVYKIEQLTSAQVYFLQSEIGRYWHLNRGERHNLDEFVDNLL